MDIQDKVAIVTGAGSGIGRATALRLASEGASVIVADVNEDGGKETVAEIEASGGRAQPLVDIRGTGFSLSAMPSVAEAFQPRPHARRALAPACRRAGVAVGQPS